MKTQNDYRMTDAPYNGVRLEDDGKLTSPEEGAKPTVTLRPIELATRLELTGPGSMAPRFGQVWGGADSGSSGAMAFVDQAGNWEVHLVGTVWQRGHRLMAIGHNAQILKSVAVKVGGTDKIVMAYEQTRKNPRFGTKNNWINGRHEEFWRVLLAAQNIRNVSVDPKTWQSVCLKGIDLPRTKDKAREYIRRRCPGTEWLDGYNKAPREAIVDAMCICLWCRDHSDGSYDEPIECEAA